MNRVTRLHIAFFDREPHQSLHTRLRNFLFVNSLTFGVLGLSKIFPTSSVKELAIPLYA